MSSRDPKRDTRAWKIRETTAAERQDEIEWYLTIAIGVLIVADVIVFALPLVMD